MISLHHLQILDAVATAGSVTAGARRLLISQPAVSKQLRQLQRALKTQLYQRTPSGVRLTPAGEVAAGHARQIVALSENLPRALADLNSLRTGTLRVAATPTLGTYLLPELLIRFRRKYAGIALAFELCPLPVLQARLAGRDLDLGLTDQPPLAKGGSTIFAHDDFLAIASMDHALARKRGISAARFFAEPLILQDRPEPHPPIRGHSLLAALTLPTVEAVKRAVAAGLGVAVLPRYTVRAELASGTLAAVQVRTPIKPLPLFALRPPGQPDSKAVIAFAYLAKHAARGSLSAVPATRP